MRTLNMIRNVRNWPSYLCYKTLGRRDGFSFETRIGTVAVPGRLMHTFKENFFEPKYLLHLPESVRKKHGPVVVDIGANVGYFSLFVLGELDDPSVYSFEPIGRNFAKMREYAEAIGNANWHIANQAVAGRAGRLQLFHSAGDDYTTAASVFAQDAATDIEDVECVTLLDLIAGYGLAGIDILKLDCEGAEFEILYSLSDSVLASVRSITMEAHRGTDPSHNRAAMALFLQARGYEIRMDDGDFLWAWRKDA